MLSQLIVLFAAVASLAALPSARPEVVLPISIRQVAAPPELKTSAAFLIDTVSGQIIYAKNADAPLLIASITKLMTAYAAARKGLPWEREITFEARDERVGDIPHILRGETITVRDTWNLMLVASSNDAAAMLARAVSGSEEAFVGEMQKTARALGLKRSRFSDVSGLDPGNVSTAREVAALARAALAVPEIRETLTLPFITFTPRGKGYRNVANTNKLVVWSNQGALEVFGGKTGHIEESRYNLVFAAGKDGHELMGVVLGSENSDVRFTEMRKLITWGFDQL